VVAFNANLPTAVLFAAVVFDVKVFSPIAVFEAPVVVALRVLDPTPVLLVPGG